MKIHQWTWYSPDGRTRKALDHIIVTRRWRSFVTNARVYRGAQLGNTDHRMLVGTFKLKLKLSRPAQNSRPLDSRRLKDPTIASAYKCSISNKFNALADATRSDWKHFAEEVTHSVACTAGAIRHRPKTHWISSDTLKIIDQRRSACLSGNLAEYRRPNREGNAAIRSDRRKFWNDQAKRLEMAAETNNFSQVFKILRRARAEHSIKTPLVKDREGHIINNESGCIS